MASTIRSISSFRSTAAISVCRRNRARRVFVDFGGVMTAATVWINGQKLGEYRGGYTPFSFELTPHLNWRGDNVLAVEVDSTERKDIPPFGGEIDYLTFGGIYRDVALRVVPSTFIENVFARPVDVLTDNRSVEVRCYLTNPQKQRRSAQADCRTARRRSRYCHVKARNLLPKANALRPDAGKSGAIDLWNIDRPKLYQVRVKLFESDRVIDQYETRIGFREARFTPDGFFLNGKHLKLRGSIGIRPILLSARRCPRVYSGAMPGFSGRNSSAISCALRTIRSRRTFSTPATNSACWCWKRFPAGSTSAISSGKICQSIMSKR